MTQPLGETRTEAFQQQTPIPPVSSPAPAPRAPIAAPVAFREVSQHDETGADESHRPVRRRRRGGGEGMTAQEASLQLVETQPEQAAPVAMAEEPQDDEASRRPVRRRRRGSGPAQAEPLQMVETAAGAEGHNESQPPAP